MNNIFKNAYFGKSYKTRDGRMAIYIGEDEKPSGYRFILMIEGNRPMPLYFDMEGCYDCEEHPYDIVSEWKDVIDEDKLNKLAEQDRCWYRYDNRDCCNTIDDNVYIEAYKAGYKRAKLHYHL